MAEGPSGALHAVAAQITPASRAIHSSMALAHTKAAPSSYTGVACAERLRRVASARARAAAVRPNAPP
ncbi:MAG: hypothetical protein DI564_03875 [Rhodanobacter denitrificans]|uniref:Uncharacterized protein n=1 Tax=Rhodanobacter denitrificans TaxID=666685 RepID=A0A2W5KN18_9GAMM|nr:MAG: hypothetical protein DI564_03875 [Rhodanobacter denitrificans]